MAASSKSSINAIQFCTEKEWMLFGHSVFNTKNLLRSLALGDFGPFLELDSVTKSLNELTISNPIQENLTNDGQASMERENEIDKLFFVSRQQYKGESIMSAFLLPLLAPTRIFTLSDENIIRKGSVEAKFPLSCSTIRPDLFIATKKLDFDTVFLSAEYKPTWDGPGKNVAQDIYSIIRFMEHCCFNAHHTLEDHKAGENHCLYPVVFAHQFAVPYFRTYAYTVIPVEIAIFLIEISRESPKSHIKQSKLAKSLLSRNLIDNLLKFRGELLHELQKDLTSSLISNFKNGKKLNKLLDLCRITFGSTSMIDDSKTSIEKKIDTIISGFKEKISLMHITSHTDQPPRQTGPLVLCGFNLNPNLPEVQDMGHNFVKMPTDSMVEARTICDHFSRIAQCVRQNIDFVSDPHKKQIPQLSDGISGVLQITELSNSKRNAVFQLSSSRGPVLKFFDDEDDAACEAAVLKVLNGLEGGTVGPVHVPKMISATEHCVLMAYCGTPLSKVLKSIHQNEVPDFLNTVISNCMEGLSAIHRAGWALVDFKTDSIVIQSCPETSSSIVSFVDFESARLIGKVPKKVIFTEQFCAPELRQKGVVVSEKA